MQATQLPQSIQPGRVVHALRRLGAVEQPHRLHKQVAQRHQFIGVVGQEFGGSALHERHIRLAFAQQLQVVR